MADVRIPVHADTNGYLVLFGQGETSAFDMVSEDQTKVVFGSQYQTQSYIDIVCVVKDSHRGNPYNWLRYSGSFTQRDGNWVTRWTGNSYSASASYPLSNSSVAGFATVTIKDEHGTHYGTEDCENFKFGNGCYLGFLNKSSQIGWKFIGWKIVSTTNLTFASEEPPYTRDGTTLTYFASSDSYEGAVLFKVPSGYYTISVEALYEEEAPVVKTVTLNPNGGTVNPTTIQCTVGLKYGTLPTPTREGHRFIGWFSGVGISVKITSDTDFTESSPTTLYAHWEETPVVIFTLIFDDAGGSGGPGSVVVQEGDSYTIPSTPPIREFYIFEYWLSGTNRYNLGDTVTPTEDMTFTAIWSGGPTPPRPPRPDSQKDYMVFSLGSSAIAFSLQSGAIVYAV